MINEVKIRQMNLKDVSRVSELENKIFRNPWSKRGIEESVLHPNGLVSIVAVYKNIIIGYAFYWLSDLTAHIANIAVDTEYRRSRVGAKLLQSIFKECNINGIAIAVLEVRESNFSAIELYKKFGFEKTGLKKDYYSNDLENAVIMKKFF